MFSLRLAAEHCGFCFRNDCFSSSQIGFWPQNWNDEKRTSPDDFRAPNYYRFRYYSILAMSFDIPRACMRLVQLSRTRTKHPLEFIKSCFYFVHCEIASWRRDTKTRVEKPLSMIVAAGQTIQTTCQFIFNATVSVLMKHLEKWRTQLRVHESSIYI